MKAIPGHTVPTRSLSSVAVCLFVASALLVSCSRRTEVRIASEGRSAGWSVQLIEESEQARAMLVSRIPGGPVPMVMMSKPTDRGEKWIVVKIIVTPPPRPDDARWPPAVRAVLDLSDIALLSESGKSYSVRAVATGGSFVDDKGNKVHEFMETGESEAEFKDAAGATLFSLDHKSLWFFSREPKELTFLFAVPKRAGSLRLSL